MKIIRIPRTPAAAFDKNRPASDLLKAQARHARAVEQAISPGRRAAADPPIETEHDAAEYVGRVTKQLKPDASAAWRLPRGGRAPKSGVWLGPARLQPRKRTKVRASARKSRKPAQKTSGRTKAAKAHRSRKPAAKRTRTKKHARRR